MSILKEMAIHIELHATEGIRDCFARGADANALFKGEPLINELISEYTRGPRFKDCVRAFIENGVRFADKALLAVLADDVNELAVWLQQSPALVSKTYTLRTAYTPIYKASLLHICAEFNHVDCAMLLIKNGADVNAFAGVDENGFGGQTPIFHTVNQNGHHSAEMLHLLLEQKADLAITVQGLIWGKTYEWETLIAAVNPVSYAMMGLLPQMHRNEITISDTVALLIKHRYGIDYTPVNVPCAYLKK